MTPTPSPLRIGLTGGIGSGKSTVAQLLQARGAAVIDADAIARNVTAAHGAAMPAITRTFGAEFITPDGALDRERMRAHVFSQPEAKQALEAIIHPLVSQETQQQAQAAISKGHRTLVFDVPLLVEAGERWRPQVDRILVVDCLEETQIQRVIARNGLSREAVQRIISAQASRVQKLTAADWVIYNDGISLDTLENQVNWLPIQAD
ncbi:dephospho-CoA kinase [Limnohabitans sp. Jir61]|uniref:dephospho-CoA kinase n=1 Tax=Limnohabitans sp. Jir61 TaxID=1826168 RepID=UPI000D371BF2|nr:dephospho-CoA kinase [Limnohabitans sp. Jir61]PUE32135.1 dephospho-CoA kinase [Limnohabitans sp. Jir61]